MSTSEYDGKIIRLTDDHGRIFTGKATSFSAEYGMHEFGRDEDGIRINGYVIYESETDGIEVLSAMEMIRAEQTWQQAGAYYVRIAGMAKQHGITLRREFDEHDAPDTKYIVLTDDDFPVATCRLYPLEGAAAAIGRVVVLPEYRGKGLGRQVIGQAENWLRELGFARVVIESRDVAVKFYEKLGYAVTDKSIIHGDTFDCIRMEKKLGR